MFDSLFILEASSGKVIIQKQYRSNMPDTKPALDYFLNEVSKRGAQNASATSSRPNVVPILTIPDYYIIYIARSDLYFVTIVVHEVEPLLIVQFLHQMVDMFEDYFGPLSEQVVKDNFSTIYELLEEMLDNGQPYITEPCILKDMIPPPTILSQVMNAVALGTNFGTRTPSFVLSQVPWRTAGLKYTNNEVFFDLTETLNVILDQTGNVISGSINGQLHCTSKLSGMPDLTLTFGNSRMFEDLMTSFHPCVRFFRFEKDRVLSFIPPDGTFKLMEYTLNNPTVQILPLHIRPQIFYSKSGGRISVTIQPRTTGGRPIENVVLSFTLPKEVSSTKVDASDGMIQFDQITNHLRWSIPKISADAPSPQLTGSFHMEKPAGAGAADAGANSSGSGSGSKKKGKASASSSASARIFHMNPLVTMSVDFKISMFTVSGARIDSLHVHGEPYKPYKGVKLSTRAGNFDVRV
ncbi:Mu homology domain-containing protein [Zopfochytrium polystomum]|nr:Mu homology domain-containing protein [Zopfochytrium polystomum]